MGLRGPPPTPTRILECRGSWRAKTRGGEPKPRPGKPACPTYFNAVQRKVWRNLLRTLGDMRLLSKADGSQLERYCVYFCRWRECEEFIARFGMSYPVKADDPSSYVAKPVDGPAVIGFVEYPQVRESHRLNAVLKGIEMNFGLSPAARARLTISQGQYGDSAYERWDRETRDLTAKYFANG